MIVSAYAPGCEMVGGLNARVSNEAVEDIIWEHRVLSVNENGEQLL